MAHGRQGPDIVMTIEYADQGNVEKMTSHELHRTPDGPSAIDPDRSCLNEILHGPRTQADAVRQMKAKGVKGPTTHAETPFVQIVISASPEFFRDDPSEIGTWDKEKLRRWKQSTMDWLKKEYGDDLAHVALHLDEDTPHMHVLVVPTYTKKPRRPGRQKKNETVEEFEARRAAAENGEPVRTMSRSSNAYWKRMWVRREARVSYWKAMQPIGLGYGKDFVGSGEASPDKKETAQWVREQAADVKKMKAALDVKSSDLNQREHTISDREKNLVDLEARVSERETRVEGMERNFQKVTRRMLKLLRIMGETLGISVPNEISSGLHALEKEASERAQAWALSSTPEEPFDDAGPGL